MFFVAEFLAPKRAEKTAVFSPCGQYRLAIGRTWDWSLPRLMVVMCNPSKAGGDDPDAEEVAGDAVEDPTSLRVTAFAKRWGYGGWGGGNLHALISSDPKALAAHPDPVGSGNNATLLYMLDRCKENGRPILAAWGNIGARSARARAFVRTARDLGVPMICLGTTQDGNPKHPLARGVHRVPDDFEPIAFDPPEDELVKVGPFTTRRGANGQPVCIVCDGAGKITFGAPQIRRADGQCHHCGGTGEEPGPFGDRR